MNKIRFDQIIPLIHSSINHFKITNVKSTQQIYVIHNMVKKYLYSVYKQKN
jgi:hypothetical protein